MAVTKRIFQLAKEFEREEKEIIAFLSTQGIKVSNRLSAVSEDTYNMLKAKFLAPPPPPPEPEPEPEPVPEPVVEEVAPVEVPETPEQQPQPATSGKKKKKKNKGQQPPAQIVEPAAQMEEKSEEFLETKVENINKFTKVVLYEGIKAGNEFIQNYTHNPGITVAPSAKNVKEPKPSVTKSMDTWAILYNHLIEYPDVSPARYWPAVAKLATKSFKLLNAFGISHKEGLLEMRKAVSLVGEKYTPREIFTDEENQKFAKQQQLIFKSFGHGMGLVNDNLYALKLKAERMKVKNERMDFLEYALNPDDELRGKNRAPFNELVEAVAYSLRGVARRFAFYQKHKFRIDNIIKRFFEWLDIYANLKEQGAPAAKLEKYLELEEKFIFLVEYMSFDNLLDHKKNKPAPYDTVFDILHDYRDNMDDPDAERKFKYKIRGVTNVVYKPKEYVFLYQFADLDPNKDYRSPEEIAAAEAAKATAEAEAAANAEIETTEANEAETTETTNEQSE